MLTKKTANKIAYGKELVGFFASLPPCDIESKPIKLEKSKADAEKKIRQSKELSVE